MACTASSVCVLLEWYSYAEEPDLREASCSGNLIFVTLKHRQEARPGFVFSERLFDQTKGLMLGQVPAFEK